MKLKLDRKSRIELLVHHFLNAKYIIVETNSTYITDNLIRTFNSKDCVIDVEIKWKI
jgi:hypothetical protein